MQYSTISKVHTENGDDIHLRFGFDMTQAKLIFSIIVAIANKPEPREFQADTVEEIIAWLRFNRLSKALFNSPQFGRKYNLVKTDISESMIVLTINKLPTFYVKRETGEWDCSSDIAIFAQLGHASYDKAKEILGNDFMSRYEKREKELAEIARNQLALKTEINTVQNGINKETNTPINTEEKINIVDINSSTSSVV